MDTKIKKVLSAAGWNPIECTVSGDRLGGTNATYLCGYNGDEYFIRAGTQTAQELTINRLSERAALEIMSRLGYAPALVYFDSASGDMITRRLYGRDLAGEDFNNPSTFAKVIELIRTMHGQTTDYSFNPFSDIENRLICMTQAQIPRHSQTDYVLEVYNDLYTRIMQTAPCTGLCHNDPFPHNFFMDNYGRLYLLDYEFAGMGDVYFDLASMYGWKPVEEQAEFLKLYFGNCTQDMLWRLDAYTFVQILWNGTWSYVKSLDTATSDFDYVGFGHQHVDGLLNFIKDRLEI